MSEDDYIKATNRVKVSIALTILRDVMPGKEYGITEKELHDIKFLLLTKEADLFALIDL